jgi:hypothetical protein
MTQKQWASRVDQYLREGRSVSGGKGDDVARQSEQQQADFNHTFRQNFATRFGNQSDILGKLDSVFSGIISNPQGYSPEALTALRTNAIEGTSNQYQSALRTTQEQMAAHGDNGGLPSGVEAQIRGQLSGQAAGALSGQLTDIAIKNEDQRQSNFWRALQGEGGIASAEDPLGYASGSTAGSNSVANLSKAYQESKGPGWGSILGGIAGGVATSFLNPIGSKLGKKV